MNFSGNTIIDNSDNLKMVDALKSLVSNPNISTIRIATGYWDLPGTSLLLSELSSFFERNGKMQLLIGQEPQIREYQLSENLPKAEKFPDFYIQNDVWKLSDDYKPVAELLLDNSDLENEDSSPLQIRVYGQDTLEEQFLHAKCYIFTGENEAHGIIGSSNFTEKGLLQNAELNYIENQFLMVTSPAVGNIKSHVAWFEEKWENSIPWTGKFIKEILKKSPIGKKVEKEKEKDKEAQSEILTPYEIYIKFLQTRFGDVVDKNQAEIIESYLPEDIFKLNYQITAVQRCNAIMHEHGGFMLADVVGLGKTIVGMLIIKYFLNDPADDGREKKVLIITPPAIKSAWERTIADFDKNNTEKIKDYIDFVTTGSIGHLVDDVTEEDIPDDEEDSGDFGDELKTENYGLIMIDESHKFRNSGTLMYKALDALIEQIAIEKGVPPYIGLLSATPQNNRPSELKNQIYLFERNHNDSTLKKADGGNLEHFFAEIERDFQAVIRPKKVVNDGDEPVPELTEEQRHAMLMELSKKVRDCVLADILERRTRTDVEKHYADDLTTQGIKFPKIRGPISLEYKMDDGLAELFAHTTDMISPNTEYRFAHTEGEYINYYRYRAIQYFSDPELVRLYEGGNLGAQRYSDQLANIMKINLVKRLESSFTAFKASLHNLQRYTQNMIDMWEHNAIFVCPQIDVNKELNPAKRRKNPDEPLLTFEQCAGDIRKIIARLDEQGKNFKGRNREYTRKAFNEEYIELLRRDKQIIDDLVRQWNEYDYDPKLEVFREELIPTLFNTDINQPQKLVIFSEAIDTVNALQRSVERKGKRVLVITSKNRKEKEQEIRENFDANYKEEKKNDYDVIITTEVLAEGINLHRANVILNYDTPWNSTRLMQRIGRVNRIGSTQDFVYVYNFMPSAQGDKQIDLVNKAHTKLQSFHTMFGEDSQIFSQDETVCQYALNEMVNGEESPFEKYLHLLRDYKEAKPERFNYIMAKEENLFGASDTNGNAYFVVKAPKTSSLFVRVYEDGKEAELISTLDMIQALECFPETPSAALPDNWKEKADFARQKYIQYFSRIRKSNRRDERNKALQILVNFQNNPSATAEHKRKIKMASRAVRDGNKDIIRGVLYIDQHLGERTLFGQISFEEMMNLLEHRIGKLLQAIEENYTGKATVFLGMNK